MAIKLQRILCPTDFSESSEHALIYAFSFAQQYGATLYLLHVVEPLTPVPGVDMGPILSYDDRPNVLDRIQELLEETIPEGIKGKIGVKPLISRGAPFLEIIRTAREENIDLIVIATHGRSGLSRLVYGSTAESVLVGVKNPILLIKAT